MIVTRAHAVVIAVGLLAACRSSHEPDAYGHIEATEVVVAAQTGGQVKWFGPAEGSRLGAGALAVVIDSSALALQLQQIAAQRAASSSHVDEAVHQIEVVRTQAAIARRTYERTRRLFAAQAATAQQLDQAERDYRTLSGQVQAAQAQEKSTSEEATSTDARVAQIRDQIARSRVTNPVSGTVLTTYAKAGEYVQPGQPLYKIANLDTMELRAYVDEPQLARIKVGQTAQVTVDAGKGARRTIAGIVSWIASQAEFTPTPIVTRDERTNLVYAIKVRLPNRDGALKIGMPADVQLPTVAAAR